MVSQYLLIIVINNMKAFNKTKQKLTGYKYTVIDSLGSARLCDYENKQFSFKSGLTQYDIDKEYNKTIYLVTQSEEETIKIMDNLSPILNLDSQDQGKGIMFTIPVYASKAI